MGLKLVLTHRTPTEMHQFTGMDQAAQGIGMGGLILGQMHQGIARGPAALQQNPPIGGNRGHQSRLRQKYQRLAPIPPDPQDLVQ